MIENNLVYKIIDGDISDPKTRIVRAAIGEFAMRSIEGARTREITSKSGSNIAAISYHFGGKRGLYDFVIKELCEYFDYVMAPYIKEAKEVRKSADSSAARALISKFLFASIRKFRSVPEVSYVVLLLAREQVSPSQAYKYLYKSVVEAPTKFLATLFEIAAKGKYSEQLSLTFAHTLWTNVRSYCSCGDAVMRLHGWKAVGDAEIGILEEALNVVLEKIIKR